MRFIRIVDFESTGTDPATSDVIEVGWVDVTPDGQVSEPASMLCRTQRPIEIEAMAVHHLSEADVARGVEKDVWQAALRRGDPVALVAHSAKFEMGFFPDAGIPWICTHKSALRIWPDAPRHTNQVLRYWLKLDQGPTFDSALAMPPHRAAPDAYVTAHIFAQMLKAEGEYRLKRMLAWSREPGLLPKILFGKHSGSRWSEIPLDYLEWIGKQSDMDEDVRFTAGHEVDRRVAQAALTRQTGASA